MYIQSQLLIILSFREDFIIISTLIFPNFKGSSHNYWNYQINSGYVIIKKPQVQSTWIENPIDSMKTRRSSIRKILIELLSCSNYYWDSFTRFNSATIKKLTITNSSHELIFPKWTRLQVCV